MKKHFIFILILFLYSNISRCQQSIEDSLNRVITEYKDESEVAGAYNALGFEYTRKDVAKARAYFAAAIAIGKKINNPKRLSSSYSSLVYLVHDAGYPDSAEYYIGMIKNIALTANAAEKDALSANYYTVAALYYKRTGDKKKAIPFFENAIILLTKTGNKQSTAGQILNLGNTYNELGNYQRATEKYLKALSIFEEISNQRGMSFCYQGLSNAFIELKQYSQALNYAKKAIQIKTAINDRRGLGTAENGLGNIYLGLGNFEKALEHFNVSLNYAIEQKNLPEEQRNYFNIGKVHAAKKETKNAIDYFNKSKALAIQLKDNPSVAAIDAELIALQYNAEKNVLSENKLKTNLQLFEQQGDLTRQVSGFKNMADFYTANKQFDKALEYSNKYHQASDSIRNNELQLQVKKMEEQYTVEKKDKEITLLKKDKELQQQKLQRRNILTMGSAALALLAICGIWLLMNRNKLRQKMKELELRNRIAADLHDEVGSSLSSIHMLSQLATQPGNETTHKDILQRMSSNAKETMDKMGDIVWMIKPGETEADSLKQRMERFAYEICSNKNIDTTINLDALENIKLTMEQRKNIYLIFKEALNNAVKYSTTEKISIDAVAQNKALVFTVKDFGQGFNSSLVTKGNGLDNMQHRANELAATLTIDSKMNTGTTVELTIPL